MTKRKDPEKEPKFSVPMKQITSLEGMGLIMSPDPTRCPACGSDDFRRIVYGFPAEPLDPEEYHVGGCVVREQEWHCTACGHEWPSSSEWDLPTPQSIDRLLEFLPRLEAHEGPFEVEQERQEVFNLDVEYVPLVHQLMAALSRHGFVLKGFSWTYWEEGRNRWQDRGWIAKADLETLCKLFSAFLRQERFCAGNFGALCENGTIAVMLRRLAEIAKEPDALPS